MPGPQIWLLGIRYAHLKKKKKKREERGSSISYSHNYWHEIKGGAINFTFLMLLLSYKGNKGFSFVIYLKE